MALENYVKFLRGTQAAYDALASTSGYDKDTLYFISEVGSSSGTLYLGNKLIAGGSDQEQPVNLGDLGDVLLDNGLDLDHILVYNGTKWENRLISDVVPMMVGASADYDGQAGLVTAPLKGQHNFFLRGDGVWIDIAKDSALATEIKNLETVVGAPAVLDDAGQVVTAATGIFTLIDEKANKSDLTSLEGTVGELNQNVVTLIGSDANKSVRQIASEELAAQLIGENASESLDTLQEIAAWIQSHPEDAATMNAAIEKNKTDIATLNTTIGTLQTTVNDLSADLTGLEGRLDGLSDEFVSLNKYNLEVGQVSKLYTTDTEGNTVETTVVDEILAIHEAMKWQDL